MYFPTGLYKYKFTFNIFPLLSSSDLMKNLQMLMRQDFKTYDYIMSHLLQKGLKAFVKSINTIVGLGLVFAD